MKIVTVRQMQAIEKSADSSGLTFMKMMRNAGQGIANWVHTHLPTKSGVIGLVGSGNNGGDTLIALRTLSDLGVRTSAFIIKNRKNDPLISELISSGGSCVDVLDDDYFTKLDASLFPGVIVLDGILGTGFRLPLRGKLSDQMSTIYDLVQNSSGTRIIAVDCPSGLDCDTGECSEHTIRAEYTLCMAAIKQGLLKMPGHSFTGDLAFIDIGISNPNEHISDPLPETIDLNWVKKKIPGRSVGGHKGTFGTCLVIAGSRPYTGAAYLTGKAAYRSGCGLVNIGTINSVQQSLSGAFSETVWTILPELDDGYDNRGIETIIKHFKSADGLVLGPGWGLNHQQEVFLRQLLPSIPRSMPTLIDADGLKLLKRIDHWWEQLPYNTILTPHPGEMSILTGMNIREIQANRWQTARKYAQKWGVVLILKGALSTIVYPSGRLFVIPISDSALATAGSGDVLSGAIGGMLAQGWDLPSTALIGAWMHAHAGVAAKKKIGNRFSVTAVDILEAIPDIFSAIMNEK